MRLAVTLPVLLAVLSGCGGSDSSAPVTEAEAPAPRPARLGLWVLAEGSERALEDPARVDRLLEGAAALGASDLFVQVYRRGRSWFPSSNADETPWREMRAAQAEDPLARLVERAHAAGLEVHAWFNALSLADNADAPILRSVGREAVLVDRAGRSLLDYPDLELPLPDRLHMRMGTPGIWLDPATPGVIEALEATVDDLVAAAPALDGLHLDFIRHPMVLPIVPGSRFDVGLDFGYGAPGRERFAAASGGEFRRGDAWDAFRRERVDEVVRRLGARIPEGWELSAAVLPWADRAYLSAMQDWRRWLEEGWLDFAVAMAYTRDDRLLGYLAQGLTGGVGGERVWLGLGTWLFAEDGERAGAQLAIARESRPGGVALFSWDAIAARPELWARLAPAATP